METTKQIIITLTEELKPTNTKKINCEKEKKKRIETTTWGLSGNELLHATQLSCLVRNEDKDEDKEDEDKEDEDKEDEDKDNSEYTKKLTSHLKNKIYGYKQQDILKHKFHESEFITLENTLDLLKDSQLRCCYCSEEVYILYEHVRDMKQWTLDRVNNDIGHNKGNVVISCLGCNLKRRRTNKDAFMFTKNMVIIKEE